MPLCATARNVRGGITTVGPRVGGDRRDHNDGCCHQKHQRFAHRIFPLAQVGLFIGCACLGTFVCDSCHSPAESRLICRGVGASLAYLHKAPSTKRLTATSSVTSAGALPCNWLIDVEPYSADRFALIGSNDRWGAFAAVHESAFGTKRTLPTS